MKRVLAGSWLMASIPALVIYVPIYLYKAMRRVFTLTGNVPKEV